MFLTTAALWVKERAHIARGRPSRRPSPGPRWIEICAASPVSLVFSSRRARSSSSSARGRRRVIWKFEQDLPDYSQLKNYEPPVMTRVHAADGSLLAEYARERRLYLPSAAIPPLVKEAFIAAEDKNFYSHRGFDPEGIVRAGFVFLQGPKHVQGASTITQQVAKNFLLTSDRRSSARSARSCSACASRRPIRRTRSSSSTSTKSISASAITASPPRRSITSTSRCTNCRSPRSPISPRCRRSRARSTRSATTTAPSSGAIT